MQIALCTVLVSDYDEAIRYDTGRMRRWLSDH